MHAADSVQLAHKLESDIRALLTDKAAHVVHDALHPGNLGRTGCSEQGALIIREREMYKRA